MKKSLIRSINWIITDRCNCRCVHCDIWKVGSALGASVANIRKVLDDPLIEESYKYYGSDFDISLGGGEPFLVDNLQEIVEAIEKKFPSSFKCITTNGLHTSRIIKFIGRNKNLDFKINISIDGLRSIHDKMRGGKGLFDRTLGTIVNIRKVSPFQKIDLKLTLIPRNYNQITKVYKLAEKLGCGFTFKPAENIRSYTNRINDIDLSFTPEQLCVIRNQAFYVSDQMYKKGDFKKAKFFKDIPFYLFSKRKKDKCSVLDNDITIMPDGKIFTCLMIPALGNGKKEALNKLWSIRTRNLKCPSCMLMCGAYKDYTVAYFEKKVANVETTLRCNLDCKMCTQRELIKKKSGDMNLDAFKRIIQKYKNITHVSFIGGEPFLNKDFFKMMDFLDKRALTYEITTNGTLIDERIVDRLKSCAGLKKINFSLDGFKKYHDAERGRGVFDKCVRALNLTLDFFLVNVCVLMKEDNFKDIPKLVQYLAKQGVKSYKIIYCMNFSGEARRRSLNMHPELKIQGPHCGNFVRDLRRVNRLFNLLDRIGDEHKISVTYEPVVMKDKPGDFLKGRVITDSQASCRQLYQFRFDNKGERIICEFIRTKFTQRLATDIAGKLLPICSRCCKVDIAVPDYRIL